jgi:hypothetical protein
MLLSSRPLESIYLKLNVNGRTELRAHNSPQRLAGSKN